MKRLLPTSGGAEALDGLPPQRIGGAGFPMEPLHRYSPKSRPFPSPLRTITWRCDVLFSRRKTLAALYHRLLDYAAVNFSAPDILPFLGRRLHGHFHGEVLTDCKRDRSPGARIKHRVQENWLKMDDKFGPIPRIETVINQPREFRVRRQRTRNGNQ